ncbi:MAG: hypothetical protein IIB05_10630 [Bacteroidetes bacterium]|nr:hypothetical protein [Bacteroidota bacterium]
MKNIFFLLSFILSILLGCEKSDIFDEYVPISHIDGVWIENINKSDTINFDNWHNPDIFELKRGIEYRNGYYLPKKHSGPYEYKISKDSISLQNLLSSSRCWETYYFRVNKSQDAFIISDFIYKSQSKTGKLIFTRIE